MPDAMPVENRLMMLLIEINRGYQRRLAAICHAHGLTMEDYRALEMIGKVGGFMAMRWKKAPNS